MPEKEAGLLGTSDPIDVAIPIIAGPRECPIRGLRLR